MSKLTKDKYSLEKIKRIKDSALRGWGADSFIVVDLIELIDEMRVALEFYAVRDSNLPIEISPARAVLQKLGGEK